MNKKRKDYLKVLLLALFLGHLGIHRFYTKKIGTGILMLITCGGFLIWYLIDLIMILTGNFKDDHGKKLSFSIKNQAAI